MSDDVVQPHKAKSEIVVQLATKDSAEFGVKMGWISF